MKNATHCLKKCYAIVASLVLMLSLFPQTLTMTAFGAEVKSIDECNLSDFSNWRSGTYEQLKGAYTTNASRICLNDYKRVTPGRTYVAHIPNLGKEYYFSIRELTSDKKMVQSVILQDGDGFTVNAKTSYLGVSFYSSKQPNLTFQDYKSLFQNGCKLSFSVSADGKTVRDPNMTGPVLGFDWSDLSYWRIGMYQAPTGNYVFYQPRICLNDYVNATPGATYRLESSADSRYYMQIREMTADNKFIQSVFLGKGQSFVATDHTAYLAVSIGDGKGDHGNYQQYLKLFQEGWKIRLMKQGGTQSSGGSEASKPENGSVSGSVAPSIVVPSTSSSVAPSTPNNVVPSTPSSENGQGTSYDLSAESNWKVGMYHFTDGKYLYTPTRICLKDYIACKPNATYQLESSADSRYYMAIRQMTADKTFISSIFVGKGETFKVAANAAYLGVTIQNGKGDHWGYEDYKAQFDQGWKIRLICKDAGGNTQKPSFDDVENEDLTGGTDVPSSGNDITSNPSTKPVVPSTPSAASSQPSVVPSTPSKASVAPSVVPSTPSVAPSTPAQDSDYTFLKSEMKRLVMNNSKEKVDIYRYNLKYAEMHKIWDKALENDFELQVAASCYAIIDFGADKDAKGIVKNIYLAYPDDDFIKRFQNAWGNVQKMYEFIDHNKDMTDLDKIIYIHDYIVLHNFYRTTNTALDYCGGAALAGEGSVCQGYRVAMGLMLDYVGIDSTVISNNGHTWNRVKLDGEWYHLDATWAERQPISHIYLLRNDAEYLQPLGGRAHRAWTNKDGHTSTSTKYSNWFVHNINVVMCYGGGYWYYKDGTKLMKAKSDGSDIQIVGDDTTAGEVLDPETYTSKYFMKNY